MNKTPSILYRTWAVMIFGPGDRRLSELSERYPDPAKLYMALGQDDRERSYLHPRLVSAIDSTTLENAHQLLVYCQQHGIGVVSIDDRAYPARLRNIYGPPQILFYIGSLHGMDQHMSVGIVGTRDPSEYSRQAAGILSSELAKNGVDIISGCAEGIDITSQLACAHAGGRTYAVMGCGVDVEYPRANARYRQIIADNGAIISEFLPGTTPYPKNFPQRNRILAGLSDCVLVVEAGKTSGSLNTATHAGDQGKTVMVVPPTDIFDKRYAGNILLLRDGAVTACGTEDVLNELRMDTTSPVQDKAPAKLREEKAERRDPAPAERRQTKQRTAPPQKAAPKDEPTPIPQTGDELGDRIVAQIARSKGITLPYLIDNMGADTDRVLELLTELELTGTIELIGNEYFLPGQKGKDRGK